VRKAYSPALYEALAQRVVTQLGAAALEPHHCSLLAWSFAKQGLRHEALLQAVGQQAAAVADRLAPQVGVNKWACCSSAVACCDAALACTAEVTKCNAAEPLSPRSCLTV
jgi:hypothetical protein